MIDAYDLNDPDPEKHELASVELVDDLFGPGLLDRLARQEGREVWLREVRARQNDTHRTVAHGGRQVAGYRLRRDQRWSVLPISNFFLQLEIYGFDLEEGGGLDG